MSLLFLVNPLEPRNNNSSEDTDLRAESSIFVNSCPFSLSKALLKEQIYLTLMSTSFSLKLGLRLLAKEERVAYLTMRFHHFISCPGTDLAN